MYPIKKRILALLPALSLTIALLVSPTASAADMTFSDVQPGSWYYTYVKDLYDAGLVSGTSSTTFDPQGKVTLGQALKLILTASGFEAQAPTGKHWASGYHTLATKLELLSFSASKKTLDDSLSRLEIAELAANALQMERTEHTPTPFTDTTNAKVLALYDHGIIMGDMNQQYLQFYPDRQLTRAEFSAIVWRITRVQAGLSTTPDKEEPLPVQPETPEIPETPADPVVPMDPIPPVQPDQTENTASSYITFYGHKVPINPNIPANSYDKSAFQYNKNGYMTYQGGVYDYKIGIDVSRYQKDIDWAAVKASGVDFAIIRVGYRGYGTGFLAQDTYFVRNMEGALAAGLEVGVYFFSQAITPEEAIEEAQYTLNRIRNYSITYPVIFDWEPYPSSKNPRTANLSDDMLTRCAAAFCETVKAAGYSPMVYSNLSYFYLHFDLSKLSQYPFWLAQYTSKPSFYYHFSIWQYGSGTVPGIEGETDLNIQLLPKFS